jgi:3,4-dihydroxy 2-butanone 4-phosphate synthase
MASEFVKPTCIKTMRKDGGGLIFLMISYGIAQKFYLPFITDLFLKNEKDFPVLSSLIANDIPYDTKSSFSLYINHRKTFTGITDNDRSLTMQKFAEISKIIQDKPELNALKLLGNEFRSPGHVPICIASENPLTNRFGHTELAVAILKMSGLCPVASGCEIMGDNGKALSKKDAKNYALDNDLIFIEGNQIKKSWKKWSK